ncbi:hypothetical protein ABZV14_00745 [Streptosporangium canum]|uniref:hypothetical protein n=1 Tax=Streptosporangium canum TaxID=324952 RepID=UPI0033B02088
MIYQHSTDERQREVARKLGDLARGALRERPGTEADRGRMKIKAQAAETTTDLGFCVPREGWSLGDSNS